MILKLADLKLKIMVFVLVAISLSSANTYAGLSKTEVSQLYVSLLNRGSEGNGNYWFQENFDDFGETATYMLNMQVVKDYLGPCLDDDQAFVELVFKNTLNRAPEDGQAVIDGIAFWVEALKQGYSRGFVLAELIQAIKDYGPGGSKYNPADTAATSAYDLFTNRVEISDYLADNQWETLPDYDTATRFGTEGGLNVTHDMETVTEIKNFITDFTANAKYLVKADALQSVQAFIIRNAAAILGHPEFNEYFKHDIKAVRLVYRTKYKDRAINASGLLCYPLSNEKSYPLLVIQNGLLIADRDAPSAFTFSFPDKIIGFEFIASAGYFVLIPDLIGLGASKDILLQMYNAQYAASAAIDMMKAAEEYISANTLPLNDQIFLSGYSMGGFAANATLKAIEYENFRNITATAIGAGGYDLVEVMNHTFAGQTVLRPGQLALFFASYNQTYEWDRPLSDFFNPPYASKIPELINGNYGMDEIDEHLSDNIDSLISPIFLNRLKNGEETEFIAALRENSVYDWAPRSLLRLYHSKTDERVPFSDSWNTYQSMRDAGSNTVEFEELFGENHFAAAFGFMESVLPWFESLKYKAEPD